MRPLIFIFSLITLIYYKIAFLCMYHRHTGYLEESHVLLDVMSLCIVDDMLYCLILHRCLNIGTSIVTVTAVTERDEVEFRYSPDRYDPSSDIQTTMSYSVY